jgi:Protein of unknown function (DUF1822)
MTYSIDTPLGALSDLVALPEAFAELDSAEMQQAVQESENLRNPQHQWKRYLNQAARIGFQKWIKARSSELTVNLLEHNQSIDPIFDTTCPLFVGGFKVSLITSSLDENFIDLPRVVIDAPRLAAHFYVCTLIEESFVGFRGFIRHDQLMEHCRAEELNPNQNWIYEVPVGWFDSDLDHLILFCRCLNPAAIALPVSGSIASEVQQALASRVRLGDFKNNTLWDLFSWEEALVLYSSPPLIQILFERMNTHPSNMQRSLPTLSTEAFPFVKERLVNVARWFFDEIDAISEEIGWMAIPAPAFAIAATRGISLSERTDSEFRAGETERLLQRLRGMGMDIPEQARGAFQNLRIGSERLRLYAAVWLLPGNEEWSLLLILGAQTGNRLSDNVHLQVRAFSTNQSLEDAELIDEQVVREEQTDVLFLYSRVIGSLQERFVITVQSSTGESEQLLPFAMDSLEL